MKKNLKFSKPKKKINYEKLYDKEFSKKIRSRGICEFHQILADKNIPAPCRCNGVLQNCHKISRSKKVVKYDLRNVFAGCSGSNLWANYHQIDWYKLWTKMFPEDVEYLELKERMKYKRPNDFAWQIMIDELKGEK